jgi:uroporphyrinogen-III decarboxylase
VVAQTHGAFNVLNQFRKLEDVMMDALEDEGFYRTMMEYFLPWQLKQNLRLIQAGADAVEITGNMATSAVGPLFFERYVLEYENRLARGVHDAGAFNIYHNCGDAAKIMHLYNRMDIDAWGYLTPPPYGDVDLDQALRVMRPDMILRGNVDQVEFLMKATPEQVRERVREVLLKAKPRGNWILSTTDFFFDDTPYGNVRAFVETGHEFGIF